MKNNVKSQIPFTKSLIIHAYENANDIKFDWGMNDPDPFEFYFKNDKYSFILNTFAFYVKDDEKRRWCYRIYKSADEEYDYRYINPETLMVYKNMEELDINAMDCPVLEN